MNSADEFIPVNPEPTRPLAESVTPYRLVDVAIDALGDQRTEAAIDHMASRIRGWAPALA